jgi:Ca2+-binding RTX toxin-like protein
VILCNAVPHADPIETPTTIIGGAGNDTLTGGTFSEILQGGDGNDVMNGRQGNDVFQGGPGNDTADYSDRGYSFRISLNDLADDTASTINEVDNVHSDVETVLGGSGNDLIAGTSAANFLQGNGGNDTLVGNEGADVLRGGNGNDLLDGENGKEFQQGKQPSVDQLVGDAGIDTADYSARGLALKLSLDNIANDGSAGENDNIHADVENILGGKSGDAIVGNPFANSLVGNGGNDTIWAGEGNDTLVGGAGNDQLFGQGGNDRLLALDGAKDSVDGGLGTDVAQRDPIDLVTNVESII